MSSSSQSQDIQEIDSPKENENASAESEKENSEPIDCGQALPTLSSQELFSQPKSATSSQTMEPNTTTSTNFVSSASISSQSQDLQLLLEDSQKPGSGTQGTDNFPSLMSLTQDESSPDLLLSSSSQRAELEEEIALPGVGSTPTEHLKRNNSEIDDPRMTDPAKRPKLNAGKSMGLDGGRDNSLDKISDNKGMSNEDDAVHAKPHLRMPPSALSSIDSAQTEGSPNSESLFSNLKSRRASTDLDRGSIATPTSDISLLASTEENEKPETTAEDDAANSLTCKSQEATTSSSNIHHNLVEVEHSPNLSAVSPLLLDLMPSTKTRTSSTPGPKKKSPRQRFAKIIESSEDEEARPIKKQAKKSPRKLSEFKMPSEKSKSLHFLVLGGLTLTETQFLKSELSKFRSKLQEFSVPREKADAALKGLKGYFSGAINNLEPEGQAPKSLRGNRLSDASTSSGLSAVSRASSNGSGYFGDGSGSSTVTTTSGCGVDKDQKTGASQETEAREETKPTKLKKYRKSKAPCVTPIPEKKQTCSPVIRDADQDSIIKEGSFVFAKFQDTVTQYRYWPGQVIQKLDTDHWLVRFHDDELEEPLSEMYVIPITALKPPMQVEVWNQDQVSSTGVIKSFADLSQSGNISFQVNFLKSKNRPSQEEDKLVSFREMYLTRDQAESVKETLGGKWSTPILPKTDIDLNNIIHSRTRAKPSSTVSTPVSTPKKRKNTQTSRSSRKRGGEYVETSAQESDGEKPRSKRRLVATSDEESPQPRSGTKAKARRKGSKSSSGSSETLFSGMTFILTQGTKPKKDYAMQTETEDSDLNQSFGDTSGPQFNRSLLQQQILDHGGQVLDSFPGQASAIPEDLILLTDGPCETMTYLLAVAYGFKRLNFQWVTTSLSKRKKEDMSAYELQVGYSEKEGRDIEHNEIGVLTSMLAKWNVLLTSKSVDFIDDWKRLLVRLGASVCSRTGGKIDRSLKKVHLVVADRGSPLEVLQSAQKLNLPVVTSKWIIQSLINGRRQDTKDYTDFE